MTMLQYCCFTSILCLRHQEDQVGPVIKQLRNEVVEINKTRPMMIIIVQKSFWILFEEIILNFWLQLKKKKKTFLTWYLGNMSETWSFNGNSVKRQRNKPL